MVPLQVSNGLHNGLKILLGGAVTHLCYYVLPKHREKKRCHLFMSTDTYVANAVLTVYADTHLKLVKRYRNVLPTVLLFSRAKSQEQGD
jgi:hypothetical protein